VRDADAQAHAEGERPLTILFLGSTERCAEVERLLAAAGAASVLDRAGTYAEAAVRAAAGDIAVVITELDALPRGSEDQLEAGAIRKLAVPVVVLAPAEDPGRDREAMYEGAADWLVAGSISATHLARSLRYAVERHRDHVRLRDRAAALVESELVHHSTFNDAPVGMAHIGLDGSWLRINPRLCEKLGYPVTELRQRPLPALVHPDDLPAFLTGGRRLVSGEIARDTREMRCRRADGTYLWLQLSASLHRSPGGEPRHFIMVLKDITRERQIEEELDHLFNLSPDMISMATYDGYFVRTNAAWTATLGYSAEELRAVPLISFVHPDDRAATMAAREHVLSGGRLLGFTNRYRTRAGDYRWIEWHTKADTASQVIYAVARDRTESVQLEEQLRQSQKMDAVGRLAGGIAHDFNNLLTAIIVSCDMALDELPKTSPTREHVEQVRLAGDSAATLTRQLLAFSRKQVLNPEIFDLNELLRETRRLLARIIGEDIELLTELADGPCGVNADRAQIEHAIVNLAVNARDAMPAGGTLRIATEAVTLTADTVARYPGTRPGRHVLVRVSDTGVGMPPEVLAHVFEPFFTTKEEGKGTGLGLSTVYGTVQQSGGHVSLTSTPGEGTTVTIALPQVTVLPPPRRDPPPRERAVPLASATILVAEDQAEVRHVVRRTLAGLGYTVFEAESGPAALRLLEATSAPVIDLLLTDIVMPQMSGRELATEVVRRFPSTRVLYMSGYTAKVIGEQGILEEGVALLQKPFTTRQLRDRVREVLDAPPYATAH
jgi:PAS domain S-box-containing protein